MLLYFGGARQSKTLGGQQNLIPNLKLYNPMVLVIVSLLSFLCVLHISLGSSNQLLHPNNKLSVGLTLFLCTNHNIYGVCQLLPKNKLRWREL